MLTNRFKEITTDTYSIPILSREDQKEWIPCFEHWSTVINSNTTVIHSPSTFQKKLQLYSLNEIDSKVGRLTNTIDGTILFIYYKILIDSEDMPKIIKRINQFKSQLLKIVTWQKRYCTYAQTSSQDPWLHSIILNEPNSMDSNLVIHHINGVSADNRKQNLHLLPKSLHDKINNNNFQERKKVFQNHNLYWKNYRERMINLFIQSYFDFILPEIQKEFLLDFAKINLPLAYEIASRIGINIDLSNILDQPSFNRTINPHLSSDYLDSYELENFLKDLQNHHTKYYDENTSQLRFL